MRTPSLLALMLSLPLAACITDGALDPEQPLVKQTGVIPGPGGPETVTYVVDGDQAIVEGDMVFPLDYLDEYRNGPTAAAASRYAIYRWPDGVVPIAINGDIPNKNRIYDAVYEYSDKTDIVFWPRTSQVDYVRFIHSDDPNDCRAHVGKIGGEQFVWVGDDCTTGNLIHELGHSIGLYHEHTRKDRDEFVDIKWENIEEDKEDNFNVYTFGHDLGSYDYGSVMHYPKWAFSNGDGDTIVPLESLGGKTMGQRDGLSSGDIAGIHWLYTTTITTVPSCYGGAQRPQIKLLEAGKWNLVVQVDVPEHCRDRVDSWALLGQGSGTADDLPAVFNINFLWPGKEYCYTARGYRDGYAYRQRTACFETLPNPPLTVGGWEIKM